MDPGEGVGGVCSNNRGYNGQPWNTILHICFCMASAYFCALFGVFLVLKGYRAYVTGFSTSCSLPFHPYFSLPPPLHPLYWHPFVPSDWTTHRPFMPPVHQLDCTLGSLSHWAWSCLCWDSGDVPPPPPPSLLCVALTPSCFLLLPAVLYKYAETHILNTDRLCQFSSYIWMRAQKNSKESNIPFLSPVVWMPGTWAAVVTQNTNGWNQREDSTI